MRGFLDLIQNIVTKGQELGEIRRDVNAKELVTLVISTLEGSLMMRRLQKSEEPLALACQHIEEYLEEKVRA